MYLLIKECLNSCNFIVKYHATDGIISFDKFHRTFFKETIEPILGNTFDGRVEAGNLKNYIPYSDLFHLLKFA